MIINNCHCILVHVSVGISRFNVKLKSKYLWNETHLQSTRETKKSYMLWCSICASQGVKNSLTADIMTSKKQCVNIAVLITWNDSSYMILTESWTVLIRIHLIMVYTICNEKGNSPSWIDDYYHNTMIGKYSKILFPANFSHILENCDFVIQRPLFACSSGVFGFDKQVKQ